MTVASVKEGVGADDNVVMYTWTLTTAAPIGLPVQWSEYADRTAMFNGEATWGAATAVIEGVNALALGYVGLADPQGTAISKTADAVEIVTELTKFVRPRLSVVGAGAVVIVSILMRRQPR